MARPPGPSLWRVSATVELGGPFTAGGTTREAQHTVWVCKNKRGRSAQRADDDLGDRGLDE